MAQNNDVPTQYSATNKKAYNDQRACMAAWEGMKWPTHNEFRTGKDRSTLPREVRDAVEPTQIDRVSELYSSENFRAYQLFDGRGIVMHYSTREAIRLSDGTVISNSQCWSEGFAHCTSPSDKDYELPLTAIEAHLDDADSVWDISTVVGQPTTEENEYTGNTHTYYRVENTAVKINGEESTYWVLIGKDPSIKEGNSRFTMRVETDELQAHLSSFEVDYAINDLLLPEKVRESGYDVVSSDEFARTRLDENERVKHEQAGGKLAESQSRWWDEPVNYQHFRADLQGKRIVRQGEWFFIPRPSVSPKNVGNFEGSDVLDNHVAARHDSPRVPLPTECESCGGSSFALGDGEDRSVSCRDCGHTWERPIYVRGEVRHADGDHDAINLGETWHEAVTHDRDVRIYDPHPSKGNHSRSRRERVRWD